MKIQMKVLNKEFYRRDKLGGMHYDTPLYQTSGAAAVDLVCTKDIYLHAGDTQCVHTGLAIWIGSNKLPRGSDEIYDNVCDNHGVSGLILPRSGLGTKGLILANTIGLIDEDYQGELLIQIWNRNKAGMLCLEAGDRFAQLLFIPIIKARFEIVEDFNTDTQRGAAGFGSTGDK